MTTLNEQTIETIQKIAKRLAPKYVFGYYTVEDIEQEAFLIGVDGFARYDASYGPLENFLHVHVNNRLHNFRRDNFYRPPQKGCAECPDSSCESCQERQRRALSRRYLTQSADPALCLEQSSYTDETTTNIELDEIKTKINLNLPMDMRIDYLRMLDGVYVPKQRRIEIENKILEIINAG